MPEARRTAGVCAVSSGNHAQAVALAAREFGTRAIIHMPADTPPAKVEATRGYGAEIVTFDRYSAPQDVQVEALKKENEFTYVSSHDDPLISAGAGTAALELVDDCGGLDVLVAPIGGGGGIAGYASGMKGFDETTRVIGVEPEASRLATRSLHEGRRIMSDVPKTIADGQQLRILGAFPFEVMRNKVDEVVTVPEAGIVETMAFLFDRLKIVAEPSGAIATAALLNGTIDARGKRVGVIVSGGNVGAGRFASLIA